MFRQEGSIHRYFFYSKASTEHTVAVDHIVSEGRQVKLAEPVLITLKQYYGVITTMMNRLGQMNTGPTIETLPASEECGTKQSWQNSSCFCCDCTPTDQACCFNETTDRNCSPSALHCVKESNTWYNMFAPGKTVVNQNISGMVPWIDLSMFF